MSQEFEQRLPDTATPAAIAAIFFADRGHAVAGYLNVTTPAGISHLLRCLERAGWPATYDATDDSLRLDEARFEAEHADYDFEIRGERCNCSSLEQHLRHMIDENGSYRRVVIQEAINFLLMCRAPPLPPIDVPDEPDCTDSEHAPLRQGAPATTEREFTQ